MSSTTSSSAPAWGWNNAMYKSQFHGRHLGHAPEHSMILFSAFRCWQRITAFKKNPRPAMETQKNTARYSVVRGAHDALQRLCEVCGNDLPQDVLSLATTVEIASTSGKGDGVHFPSPLREQDAATAIKALEASAAAAIADLRYGKQNRKIRVDVDKVSPFLMSAYLTTLDGMSKADPRIKERIPDTDLKRAQSVLYRRLSANLYRTKNPGEYYHIHGSLDADVTLGMLGLPKDKPDMTEYRDCIDYIEAAVMKHTAEELDGLNVKHGQAGIQALTWDQFRATEHGKAITQLPPLTVRANRDDTSTPPVPFSPTPPDSDPSNPRYALAGIKVLELCRVIAGPTIGRSLAAHGARVIKVTCPSLPDVPFFQLDVNTGKHAVHLDLTDPRDKAAFDALLAEADVLIDGYRPGALAKLGICPSSLAGLARQRRRGFVYVAEDCFGSASSAPSSPSASPDPQQTAWSSRPGWQQIADCATGAAFAQGAFMHGGGSHGRPGSPVVPPFPMSDYGTGALGALAALSGLHARATRGGSWVCRTSLCQYDVFVLRLGLLPAAEQAALRREHDNEAGFFALRHSDSVDEVGRRALASMRLVVPALFDDEAGLMQEAWSEGFRGVVRWPREPVTVAGLRVGHVRTARPNGFDGVAAGWEGWEEEETGEAGSGGPEK